MGYFEALCFLIRKSVVLNIRNRTALILQLVTTLIAAVVLFVAQKVLDNNTGFSPKTVDTPNPEPFILPSAVPKCIPRVFEDCITIAYTPTSSNLVKSLVNTVRLDSGLDETDIRGFASSDALNKFLLANPNRTQAAYVFEEDDIAALIDGVISFVVQVNDSAQLEFPSGATSYHTDIVAPVMSHAMNRAAMSAVSGISLDVQYKATPFAHPPLVTDSFEEVPDVFVLYGPLLFFGVFFIVFIHALFQLVDEKERGLFSAMSLAGMTDSQYYISWLIPFFTSYMVSSLLMCLWGVAFRFTFFKETNFTVYFFTFLTFGIGLLGWVFMFAALVKKTRQVASVAFSFFIITYIIASAGNVVYQENADGVRAVVTRYLRPMSAILPPVMFTKALTDAARFAAAGRALTYEKAGTYTDVFPVKDCWKWMTLSGVVALFVAVWLGNVFPGPGSTALSPLFFLSPKYWGFGVKKDQQKRREEFEATEPAVELEEAADENLVGAAHDSATAMYDESMEDEDVRHEREAVESGSRDARPLVLKGLVRRFPRAKVTAVNNLSFSVPTNSVMAILGRNGSGKTTMMKMLSTSLAPSEGDAFIYGMSVRKDQAVIRRMLGICPQFDIFWELMTAREHLNLFSALKGRTGRDRVAEADNLLDDVGLEAAADRYAGGYSGGMQRRMSVALALTGNPAILMLDECTTGTDPVSKRDLWRIIQRAKHNRVVILITHSMQESETLGDNIGIMLDGQLKVLGTALRLKNKFGAGYRITVTCASRAVVEKVVDAIRQRCSGVTIDRLQGEDSRTSDSSVVGELLLPRSLSNEELSACIKLLESRRTELGFSRFSVDQSTLEDVFKRITTLSHEVDPLEEVKDKKKRCGCF